MGWPTLPDGTVDWHFVFEDAETGLVPVLQRASTPAKLQAAYHIAVHGLFSRKGDEEVRNAYLQAADEMFMMAMPGSDDPNYNPLPSYKTKVRMLMTRIMNDRLERARAYVEAKKSGDERRLAEDNPLAALEALEEIELPDLPEDF